MRAVRGALGMAAEGDEAEENGNMAEEDGDEDEDEG